MGIVALLVNVILIARVAFNVLSMILAGSLIATYFHGLADFIERRTKWRRRAAMISGVLFTFLLTVFLFSFMDMRIRQQINQLIHTLPATVANLKSKLAQSGIGRQILDATGDQSSGDFSKQRESCLPPVLV